MGRPSSWFTVRAWCGLSGGDRVASRQGWPGSPALAPCRRATAGIEGAGENFGCLAAGHGTAPAVVGAVAGRHTGFAHPATTVATDHPVQRHLLDEEPEGVAARHILKALL